MLAGGVRFPAEFAARYRAKGYWEDRSLRETFDELFARHAGRVAIIDRDRQITYAELDRRATQVALNLLGEGLRPLARAAARRPGRCAGGFSFTERVGRAPQPACGARIEEHSH